MPAVRDWGEESQSWGRKQERGSKEQTGIPRGEYSLGMIHVSKSAWRGVRSDSLAH